ncbi:hypothetical protein K8I61_19890 [bacterium]|nr:hypothetical protein [bacterium]
MTEKETRGPEATPSAPLAPEAARRADERKETLAAEEAEWARVLANPDDEEAHKAYFRFVVKNGLLSEGIKRYTPLIDAKDDYSIEARRRFRTYQQTIRNLLFMSAPRVEPPKGRRAEIYITLILALTFIIGGFLVPTLRLGVFLGMAIIVGLIVYLIRQGRKIGRT